MTQASADTFNKIFHVGQTAGNEQIRSLHIVGEAISDVAIPPTLVQHQALQVVAFFDSSRRMVIAHRHLGISSWQYHQIDSATGWDSHNYVDLGFDESGRLHVSGNMHASPMQYWILEFNESQVREYRLDVLVDRERERRVTYPRFLRKEDGGLVFTYRDGTSGNGDFIALKWDESIQRHTLITAEPLITGGGARNAYPDNNGPVLRPTGTWHILWVWRDSPDAETTHTINYARSKDLIKWQTADSRTLASPLGSSDLCIVDPIPPGGGLINNNVKLGFFAGEIPVAVYHKYDKRGFQQVWASVFNGSTWESRQLTHWTFEWNFQGQGSLDYRIEIGNPKTTSTGIAVNVRRENEVRTFTLDRKLKLTSDVPAAPWTPLARHTRTDGLYDRCTIERDWGPRDGNGTWYIAHTSVPEQRDLKPDSAVPLSLPFAVIETVQIEPTERSKD